MPLDGIRRIPGSVAGCPKNRRSRSGGVGRTGSRTNSKCRWASGHSGQTRRNAFKCDSIGPGSRRPGKAFQLDEVEMRPDKPRLPRHDLIEGFLRALAFHLHQKPRLEVAGQELVRSPSIELDRAVILVGTKRLNSSYLSMCGQWLVSVTGM